MWISRGNCGEMRCRVRDKVSAKPASEAIKKAAQMSGFLEGAKRLRCFAVDRHGDGDQHIGVQRHTDGMVTGGFQRANRQANL